MMMMAFVEMVFLLTFVLFVLLMLFAMKKKGFRSLHFGQSVEKCCFRFSILFCRKLFFSFWVEGDEHDDMLLSFG